MSLLNFLKINCLEELRRAGREEKGKLPLCQLEEGWQVTCYPALECEHLTEKGEHYLTRYFQLSQVCMSSVPLLFLFDTRQRKRFSDLLKNILQADLLFDIP